MIIDYISILSNDQAVTTSAASANVLDLGAADLDLNIGSALYAHVFVTTGFTTSANTLTIDLRNDGSNPPTTKHQELLPATAASALTGTSHLVEVSVGKIGGDLDGRYVNMYYTCSGAIATGTLFSYIGDH